MSDGILEGIEFPETDDDGNPIAETPAEETTETTDAPEAEAEAVEAAPEAAEEASEDAPAEEAEEVTDPEAEPSDAPAEEAGADAAEGVIPEPAAPAPQPEPEPARTVTSSPRRLAEAQRALDEYQAKAYADGYDFDPFVDGKELIRLQNQVVALQSEELQRQSDERTLDDQWAQWARANPTIGDKGRGIFEGFLAEAGKKYKDPTAAIAVANEKFEERVKLIAAQKAAAAAKAKPVPPPKPKPPVTKGGATVTRTPARGPVPKAQDPEAALVASISAGIRNFP